MAFSICISNSVNAQDLFSKVYFKYNTEILASSVISTYDSTYIIAGERNGKNYIIKADAHGDPVWNKTMGDCISVQGEVVELKDSTYLFATNLSEGGTNVICCINFDTNGDTIWNSYIRLGYFVQVSSVIQTSDEGFVILGYITTNLTSVKQKIVMVKLNSIGELEWGNSYVGGDYFNWGYSVKETQDSCFVVAGTFNNYDENAMAFIMKVNSFGVPLWSNTYVSNLNNFSNGYDVLVVDDGFLMSIEVGPMIYLLKTDLDGIVNWLKWYYYTSDGDYYGVSTRRIIASSDTSYTFISPSNLIQVNEMGDLLWGTYFNMYLKDFAQSYDGGFLVVGSGPILGVKSRVTSDPQIGLVKTDELGLTDQLCSGQNIKFYDTISCISNPVSFTYESIGTIRDFSFEITTEYHYTEEGCVAFIGSTDENQLGSSIEIYPNPSTGVFHVSSTIGNIIGEIFVFDMHGSEVHRCNIDGINSSINLETKSGGFYYLQLSTEDYSEIYKIVLY